MSSVVIVVTYNAASGAYRCEGMFADCFAAGSGKTQEQAIAKWRQTTGYTGEVKR